MSLFLKIAGASMIALGVLIGLMILVSLSRAPSLNRNWSPDQKTLAEIQFLKNSVAIKNIRNIKYRTKGDYDVNYYDATFDLEKLKSLWFMVEEIASWRGPAHTLLSFEFEDGQYVAISAEIRKEVGESYSPIKGMLRHYELVYVVGDERDLIKLRTNFRKDPVFLYPVRAEPEQIRALFVSMLKRADKLSKEPEFYHTLGSSCTTNIVDHINTLVPNRVPFSFKVLFPGYSDKFAFDLGLIDTDLPYEKIRQRYQINEYAERYAKDEQFSLKIRKALLEKQ